MDWTDVGLEAIKALFQLALLIIGWQFGQQILASWELRKKRQEQDLAISKEFHQLYGELREADRMWRILSKDRSSWEPESNAPQAPDNERWRLLQHAAAAEAKFEAVVMKLVTERHLSKDDIRQIGLFRQSCQILREAIRDNSSQTVWRDPSAYQLFLSLSTHITALLSAKRPKNLPSAVESHEALVAITKIGGGEWRHAAEELLYKRSLSDKRRTQVDANPLHEGRLPDPG